MCKNAKNNWSFPLMLHQVLFKYIAIAYTVMEKQLQNISLLTHKLFDTRSSYPRSFKLIDKSHQYKATKCFCMILLPALIYNILASNSTPNNAQNKRTSEALYTYITCLYKNNKNHNPRQFTCVRVSGNKYVWYKTEHVGTHVINHITHIRQQEQRSMQRMPGIVK